MTDNNDQLELFPEVDLVDAAELLETMNETDSRSGGGGKLRPDITCQWRVMGVKKFVDGPTKKDGTPRDEEYVGGWGLNVILSPVKEDGSTASVQTYERLYSPVPNSKAPNWTPKPAWDLPIKQLFHALFPNEHPQFPKRVKGSEPAEYMKQDGSEETITADEYPAVKKALGRGLGRKFLSIVGEETDIVGMEFYAPTKARKGYVNVILYAASTDAENVEFENFTQTDTEES